MRAEEALQRAVVQLLGIYEARGLLAYCHVPNGGWRSKAEAGAFVALGVRRGVPDLLVWALGGCFGIELKSARGVPSPEQIAWHGTLASLGHRVYVCRSVDEVEAALREEGVPMVGKIYATVPRKPLDAFSGAKGTRGRVGGISSHSAVKKSEPA